MPNAQLLVLAVNAAWWCCCQFQCSHKAAAAGAKGWGRMHRVSVFTDPIYAILHMLLYLGAANAVAHTN